MLTMAAANVHKQTTGYAYLVEAALCGCSLGPTSKPWVAGSHSWLGRIGEARASAATSARSALHRQPTAAPAFGRRRITERPSRCSSSRQVRRPLEQVAFGPPREARYASLETNAKPHAGGPLQRRQSPGPRTMQHVRRMTRLGKRQLRW